MLFGGLKKAGILGMNRRLGQYILPHNPRHLYPLVDDKVKTYALCQQAKIPIPETYLVIERYGDLAKFLQRIRGRDQFVIKPARGSQGNGIIVVNRTIWSADQKDAQFETSKGLKSSQAISYHISGVLSGLHSLSSMADKAVIQQKLDRHPVFAAISPSGIPDVRVIIFRGFPVMAMVRLPTSTSGGRANLHQGAVGCGVDIATGRCTHAVHQNRVISHHPDTHVALSELMIPHWLELLHIASRCYDLTGLGYLGIDMVLDPQKGPVLLEMNARPGLSIQTANLAGLRPRLEKVAKLSPTLSHQERVALSLKLF